MWVDKFRDSIPRSSVGEISHILTHRILTLTGRSLYKIMRSGIVPRPIAFVSTMSDNQGSIAKYNIAPFSWFNMVN